MCDCVLAFLHRLQIVLVMDVNKDVTPVSCDVYNDVHGDIHCDVYIDIHNDVKGKSFGRHSVLKA